MHGTVAGVAAAVVKLGRAMVGEGYSNAYYAGEQDVIYDHDNGYAYNPIGDAYHVIQTNTGITSMKDMIINGTPINHKKVIKAHLSTYTVTTTTSAQINTVTNNRIHSPISSYSLWMGEL
jgi:hypothetical protein